ncbi:MAG: hypothetical protein ACOYU3_06305, partial [Bacillota bacterium]
GTSGQSKTTATVNPSASAVQPTGGGLAPASYTSGSVTLYDYAANEVSGRIAKEFVKELNSSDYHEARNAPLRFNINAAVPFEDGALICGYFLSGEENPSQLYYFTDKGIEYQTFDSDVWSLNYTTFMGHTIAYGRSLGYDNGVVMQKNVKCKFANDRTAEQAFSNIPDAINPKGVITDGYILVTEGKTWVKNIEFYGHDDIVQNSWKDDTFKFDARLWKGTDKEIWNVYRYTPMLKESPGAEVTTLAIKSEGTEHILDVDLTLDDNTSIEYVWRGNNNRNGMLSVKSLSEPDFKFENLKAGDEVLWVDLNADDGCTTDIDSLISKKTPEKAGTYCLIVKRGNVCYSRWIVFAG